MGKVAETNLLSMEFWRKLKSKWGGLSDVGKKKYLAASIELTLNAWAYATDGTGLIAPLSLKDFEFQAMADLDGDGVFAEKTAIYSDKMYYGKMEKKCKVPWEATAVKTILKQLVDQYKLRETL